MKYLTREWYYGNKDICLDLEVDSNAEQLSEEYYKELYNKSKINKIKCIFRRRKRSFRNGL